MIDPNGIELALSALGRHAHRLAIENEALLSENAALKDTVQKLLWQAPGTPQTNGSPTPSEVSP